MAKDYKFLTKEQVNAFLEDGYIVIEQAFLHEWADKWTEDFWIRLGYDPNDTSTWQAERLHMPWHYSEKVSVVAPKAWAAICDLVGEDRIDDYCTLWRNNLILNLGADNWTKENHPAARDLDNWHVDGDWFRHYLDSPEQALLVIPLFADIKPGGGATYIAPDGIAHIAKVLLEHPEGVLSPQYGGFRWSSVIPQCNKFVELTGKKGDVVLMHPLMLHTASKNYLREARIITNPPVMVKEPFNFNRDDPDEFSLVELKTLKSLGLERVDYKATGPRERIISPRVAVTSKRLEEELERLKDHSLKTGIPLKSERLKGVENIPW